MSRLPAVARCIISGVFATGSAIGPMLACDSKDKSKSTDLDDYKKGLDFARGELKTSLDSHFKVLEASVNSMQAIMDTRLASMDTNMTTRLTAMEKDINDVKLINNRIVWVAAASVVLGIFRVPLNKGLANRMGVSL